MTKDQHALLRRATLSTHALARMKEQSVADAHLRRALNEPDLVWPSFEQNVIRVAAYIGGRRLCAVIDVMKARIVTVYWMAE